MVGGQIKVFVAPLDWGLGHATRCVPIIREFLKNGACVEIAVVKSNAKFFREVFPDLRQRLCPSYNIVYPKHGFNMALWLLKNSAHLNKVMRYENHYAEEMVKRHGYDVIISDNRFAFCSKNAYNIYITHQRRIPFPRAFSFFEKVGIKWHFFFMKKYDEIWVPDIQEFPGYAGRLSHINSTIPVKYVGALSRFSASIQDKNDLKKEFNIVAIVSGVEPSRTDFENNLRKILVQIPGNHVIILGKPSESNSSWKEGNITFYTHLCTNEFETIIKKSSFVLSRGGYSTIMDMAVLGAKCIFVPTPGQYEQAVLANDLSKAGFAVVIKNSNLTPESLKIALGKSFLPIPMYNSNLLCQIVKEFLEKFKR